MKEKIKRLYLPITIVVLVGLAGCLLVAEPTTTAAIKNDENAEKTRSGEMEITPEILEAAAADEAEAVALKVASYQTFVLVKLDEQMLYAARGAEPTDNLAVCQVKLETGIVSGTNKNGRGTPTPTGLYYINSGKRPGTYLRPSDGGCVWVDYWMPFIDDAVGLHDATWRPEEQFGTDQYRHSGSHGCINMPHEDAATLYEMVEVGTPVLIV